MSASSASSKRRAAKRQNPVVKREPSTTTQAEEPTLPLNQLLVDTVGSMMEHPSLRTAADDIPREARHNKKNTPKNITTKKQRQEERRQELQACGVDVPDIPGLPIPVIPLHVHAIKKTTQFFQKDAKQAVVLPSGAMQIDHAPTAQNHSFDSALSFNDGGRSSSSSAAVMGHVLERVGQAAAQQQTNPESERARQRRGQDRDEAVQAWLQAIHRSLSDSPVIPVAALRHLWDIAKNHERVTVRRATLYLAGNLLRKSADARQWLLAVGEEQERNNNTSKSQLGEWVDLVTMTKGSSNGDNEPASSTTTTTTDLRIRLWQCEAFQWLEELAGSKNGGYEALYPRLTVALLRLRQQCPWVLHEGQEELTRSLQLQNQQTLRQWRDWAMQYSNEETRRVRQLLKRCQTCFDELVPRFGHDTASLEEEDAAVATSTNNNGEENTEEKTDEPVRDVDGDESDADIDWEDGWEGDDDDFELSLRKVEDEQHNHNSFEESHAEAVDRTLAAIQATSAIENGALEIDFDAHGIASADSSKDDFGSAVEDPVTDTKEIARKRLRKCIRLLTIRHMPRLSCWVDGLTKADNLRPTTESGETLTELDKTSKASRKLALEIVLDLKGSVASVVASAATLGITIATTTDEADDKSNTAASEPAEVGRSCQQLLRSSTVSQNRKRKRNHLPGMTNNRHKPRVPSKRNAARIQIKYRSDP